MSTIIDLRDALNAIISEGHGELSIFGRRGSSGDVGELSSYARVCLPGIDEEPDTGPFNMEEPWVELSID